jgi:hypothetical protein
MHNIECGAAAHTNQYRFHGAHAHVAPAGVRCAVHDDGVAAAGFTQEHPVLDPFHTGFHFVFFLRVIPSVFLNEA